MKRRIFMMLSALSLALWLAVAVIWVLRLMGEIRWPLPLGCAIESRGGDIIITWERVENALPWLSYSPFSNSYTHDFRVAVLETEWLTAPTYGLPTGSIISLYFAVKAWLLLIIFAIAPYFYFRLAWERRRIRIRQAKQLCVHCGYDLRASKGSCPECGTAFKG